MTDAYYRYRGDLIPIEFSGYQFPIQAFPYGSEVRRAWLNTYPNAAMIGLQIHEAFKPKRRWRAIARARGLKPSTIRIIAKIRREL